MANVVVVGSQWGDEGKGKIVDWLSEQADIVVRFQGGHNAGHTLVINGTTYKLSLLPSGVVRPGKLSVIGNGVVLDPHALLNEIATLDKQGVTVTPDNLRIAENTPLILPLHQELDVAREKASGKGAIGTTGRGIGPAYEDKVGRRAIRLMDLADLQMLNGKIERLLAHHNALRRGLGMSEIAPRALYDELAVLQDTPVVALNRAVAVAMAAGPAAALPALNELVSHPVLAGSHRVWAVRADLNRRAGRTAAALADYDRALELAGNQAERRYLAQARRDAAEAFAEGTLPRRESRVKKG